MSYYKMGEFSKITGLSIQTLRLWDSNGKLKPAYVTEGKHRYYSEEQLNRILWIKLDKQEKRTIGYARVSSNKQKDDLTRQVENLKTYMIARGYQFEIIEDIGSGINYNKKGLNELINKITNREVDKIVILYKDRLLRFGFELVEHFANLNNVKIEVLDKIDKSQDEELVEDLVQIITVFSCKIQGKRKNKIKRMLEDFSQKIQEMKE